MSGTRLEHDSLGDIAVPSSALYGAQTQRAVDNFHIAGRPMPRAFIQAIALIKREGARVNGELGLLAQPLADAIAGAADAVQAGDCDDQFPVDVYQTGSGTSSNMNVNEVLAHLAANLCGEPVHPNDHVNAGQSSNDVIPTALQLAAVLEVHRTLLPALELLADVIDRRAEENREVVKTGRTHLMDAMPLRLDQELSGWRTQVLIADERIEDSLDRLCELPLGGTAVGTGINTHPEFGARVVARLAASTGLPLTPCRNRYERMASVDCAVELSGQLRVLALALFKISNDLRWMNSGPYCGLGEIRLMALQPGSSIMPGKVNPVIPEAVAMAATQCVGLDAANALAGQSGNFQLNVMLPLVADNLLTMIGLLGRACVALAGSGGVLDFDVNSDLLAAQAAKNPILATALNPVIGYEKAAAIAKRAIAENAPILAVAQEMTDLDAEQLSKLLDPLTLTEGGVPGTDAGC
jgi:fumarate hydratase class II